MWRVAIACAAAGRASDAGRGPSRQRCTVLTWMRPLCHPLSSPPPILSIRSALDHHHHPLFPCFTPAACWVSKRRRAAAAPASTVQRPVRVAHSMQLTPDVQDAPGSDAHLMVTAAVRLPPPPGAPLSGSWGNSPLLASEACIARNWARCMHTWKAGGGGPGAEGQRGARGHSAPHGGDTSSDAAAPNLRQPPCMASCTALARPQQSGTAPSPEKTVFTMQRFLVAAALCALLVACQGRALTEAGAWG